MNLSQPLSFKPKSDARGQCRCFMESIDPGCDTRVGVIDDGFSRAFLAASDDSDRAAVMDSNNRRHKASFSCRWRLARMP